MNAELPRHRDFRAPIPVRSALGKLGRDLRDARRRRRIRVAIMAERASISRTTLNKVEKGDGGVSIGSYATVLFVLGMAGRLADLADPRDDAVGLALEEERLPQRIRRTKSERATAAIAAETASAFEHEDSRSALGAKTAPRAGGRATGRKLR